MSVPVFTWTLNYPIRRSRRVERVRLELGAGFTKTVIKTIAQNRADGTGSVSSYKGQNVFEVQIDRRNYDGNQQFKDILDFLQARVDAGDQAFYFYFPDERATPDATGVDTTGRYKVQVLHELEDMLTHLKIHDFKLTFEETFF